MNKRDAPILPLTPAQKRLVEENHNLIYWFLNRKNLSVDQWYDIAAIGICKAAAQYDPSRNVKFSTYAHFCMLSQVLQEKRNERRHAPQAVSLQNELLNGDKTLEDTIGYEQDFTAVSLREYAKTLMNPRDRTVFQHAINGLKQREIGA